VIVADIFSYLFINSVFNEFIYHLCKIKQTNKKVAIKIN